MLRAKITQTIDFNVYIFPAVLVHRFFVVVLVVLFFLSSLLPSTNGDQTPLHAIPMARVNRRIMNEDLISNVEQDTRPNCATRTGGRHKKCKLKSRVQPRTRQRERRRAEEAKTQNEKRHQRGRKDSGASEVHGELQGRPTGRLAPGGSHHGHHAHQNGVE